MTLHEWNAGVQQMRHRMNLRALAKALEHFGIDHEDADALEDALAERDALLSTILRQWRRGDNLQEIVSFAERLDVDTTPPVDEVSHYETSTEEFISPRRAPEVQKIATDGTEGDLRRVIVQVVGECPGITPGQVVARIGGVKNEAWGKKLVYALSEEGTLERRDKKQGNQTIHLFYPNLRLLDGVDYSLRDLSEMARDRFGILISAMGVKRRLDSGLSAYEAISTTPSKGGRPSKRSRNTLQKGVTKP